MPGLTLESPWGASGPPGRPGRGPGSVGAAVVRGLGPRETESAAQKQAHSPGPEASLPQRQGSSGNQSAGAQNSLGRNRGTPQPEGATPRAPRPPLPPPCRSILSASSPVQPLPVASDGGEIRGGPFSCGVVGWMVLSRHREPWSWDCERLVPSPPPPPTGGREGRCGPCDNYLSAFQLY